jgi:hypothetical protein
MYHVLVGFVIWSSFARKFAALSAAGLDLELAIADAPVAQSTTDSFIQNTRLEQQLTFV